MAAVKVVQSGVYWAVAKAFPLVERLVEHWVDPKAAERVDQLAAVWDTN